MRRGGADVKPYYDRDGITIYCGDNCVVLGEIQQDSIDLVVTSPPYDNLRTYGGHEWDFEGVAQQLWRVIKPGGVVVWVVADATVDGSETGTSFRQALRFKEIGFRLHDTMIWQKPNAAPQDGKVRYHDCFEFCFVCSKGQPQHLNLIRDVPTTRPGKLETMNWDRRRDDSRGPKPRGTNYVRAELGYRKNIWSISKPVNGNEGLQHPASFPEALARDHILSWSNEGDLVLDPFNGSGTTTKMAREMGRRAIGIDVNKEYCDIAVKRLRQELLFT